MGDETPKELPEDCLELILNRLTISDDYEDLKAPSLVCNQFFSITNRLRQKLEIQTNSLLYKNRCEALLRALQRFRNLKEIVLYDPSNVDINYTVRMIASSGLDLHALVFHDMEKPPSTKNFRRLGSTMKNLNIIRFICVSTFQNCHLFAIADAFPWLEELDISHSDDWDPENEDHFVSDAGIKEISRKLPRLRKIDITEHPRCSDQSLIALSLNCELLQEIGCSLCDMTEYGIAFVLRRCRNLISLTAGSYQCSPPNPDASLFTIENSMIYARALRVLHIDAPDHDQLLSYIAKAGIPLENISLNYRRTSIPLTVHGLFSFVRACSSLKHLKVGYLQFLNDHSMRHLCQYLPNLVSIHLTHCFKLSPATFFILAKQCPALSKIEIPHIWKEVRDDLDLDLERNYRITFLDLRCSWQVTDELLMKIGIVCPNLQTLDVRGCHRLTKEAIGKTLKCCSQIKYLIVNKSREMEIFFEQFKTRSIKIKYCLVTM